MRPALLLACAALVALAGCSDDPPVSHDEGAIVREAPTTPDRQPADPTSLEKDFLVTEGVWYLNDGDYPRVTTATGNGLLYPGGRRGLWITVPGLYGKWPVRLEVLAAEPALPRWCEDVVEVPYAHRGQGLSMGSFDTGTRSLALPAGHYRVRLCATGLDAASREPEFSGRRYHVYSSRHLLQVWPAPPRPQEILRTGSRWARAAHAAARG